ncbi:MAG: aminotransferase class V-fold PLP-dependent enzyme [Gemmatimonadota bacterium]
MKQGLGGNAGRPHGEVDDTPPARGLNRRHFLGSLPGAAALLGLAPGALRGWDHPSQVPRPEPGGRLSIPREGSLDDDFWRALRREFLIPMEEEFFNTGTLGSPPRRVLEAVQAHLLHTARDIAHWDYSSPDAEYITGYNPESVLREKLAGIMGARAKEVALTQNATVAMNLLSNGLELEAGDEVVVLAGSHTGARGGWELRQRRQGIRVRWVTAPRPPSDPQELFDLYRDASGPRTCVWVVQHLTSSQGALLFPISEMCAWARGQGIFTVVDGAQTLGHLPVDMGALGCDAFLSSPHKWLLAPAGCGVLFIREEHHRSVWATLASSQWDNHEEGLYRLMQYGTGNRSLLAGLEEAVDFHVELGAERVSQRILGLSRRLREGLAQIPAVELQSPTHPEFLTATTIWGLKGMEGRQLQDELWERGRIRVRQNSGGVRQCCHIYNSTDGVDETLQVARALAG